MGKHRLAHTIHRHDHHCGWDNSIAPTAHAKPGETLLFECLDAAGGHFTGESTADDIARMDPDKVNPVTGPVFVDGAEPGDALKVTIHEFQPSGFGWTAIIPGFGLLADQFTQAKLNLWTYDRTTASPALFGEYARVPLKPFAGTAGVALAESGRHSVIPPRRVGGNMDIRDIAAGAELYLPVEIEGALFSIGDTHAAQGDGEVCGTAIESAMNVVLTVDVVKGAASRFPRFSTPGPVTRHLDAKGYEVTTGIGPDLMAASRDAVSGMIDLLCAQHRLAPEEAYMLCSVCGDLRISEVVDAPNWVVAFYFPRVVFE
ncbi:acetamidase/formamidase family protein [Rhizobiales bacterium]|uniref:acetamidase/formamidase family protein n=1 Tax=Hongsoonwoonella zoysiae TaxID=2821844 RepID=UPI00155F9E04|nr:acetamidase/formamidase family protein [Hongsoonwoonella zoysiae]NRG16398.1 acetamidase/formamidase family protein [Hongsoonwoonella zoysiae]